MKKLILTILCITFLLTIVSAGTMTRTGPATIGPSQSFTITYTASATGTWGASIQDSVSGGCLFPSGSSTYKSVMLSTDGSTKSITVTAPASGTCSFSGDVQFGTDPISNLNSYSITVGSGTCTPSCSGKSCGDNGCGGSCGTCTSGQTCSSGICVTGTCTPSCTGKICGDNGCGGSCGTCNSDQTCESGACVASTDTCQTGETLCSDGTCAVTCTSSGFDFGFLDNDVFKIGTFAVKIWMLIAGGIVLLILIAK